MQSEGKLSGLDLFSGIGGLTLALNPWVRPIAYCENDRFAQAVLLSGMCEGVLPRAPIWDDVRTLESKIFEGMVDIIYGGFPCQDLSVAGTGAGLAGKRSGLVFELLRLVGECRPRFIFLENVPALTVRGLERLLLELHALRYDARWTIVSAAEMGAPHLRERIWILAHANGSGIWEQQRRRERQRQPADSPKPKSAFKALAANALCERGSKGRSWQEIWRRIPDAFWGRSPWPEDIPEPSLCRSANGLPMRVDRIRSLGNAVVPQSAREAFMRLAGLK